MGWHAARKLRKAVEDLNYVLAIELVTATRAIALRGIPGPAPVGEALVKQVAALGIGPGPDRYVSPQLEAAADFVRQGLVTTTAEEIIGELA
jgi:histidine ammonia-lyase